MMELFDLAEAITKAIPTNRHEGAGWFLHQFTEEDDWRKLPPALRFQVEVLAGQIGKLIPTDVHFTLSFDERGTCFGLEYSDGNIESDGGGGCFETHQELFGFLAEMNWDEYRRAALQSMNIFDEMQEAADKRPVNIPDSEKDAKKWAKPLAKALARVRGMAAIPAYVVVYASENEPVAEKAFDTEEELRHDMMDALACRINVLAILIKGHALSFPEIEAMKREEIAGLGPISRAKAEGRYF